MKKNFPLNKIFLYAYLLFFIAGVLIFIFVYIFLYDNFYKTIIQSEEIILLSPDIAPEDINMKKFEEVMKNIKQKNEIKNNPGLVFEPIIPEEEQFDNQR